MNQWGLFQVPVVVSGFCGVFMKLLIVCCIVLCFQAYSLLLLNCRQRNNMYQPIGRFVCAISGFVHEIIAA